jgi:hypothetical protein
MKEEKNNDKQRIIEYYLKNNKELKYLGEVTCIYCFKNFKKGKKYDAYLEKYGSIWVIYNYYGKIGKSGYRFDNKNMELVFGGSINSLIRKVKIKVINESR